MITRFQGNSKGVDNADIVNIIENHLKPSVDNSNAYLQNISNYTQFTEINTGVTQFKLEQIKEILKLSTISQDLIASVYTVALGSGGGFFDISTIFPVYKAIKIKLGFLSSINHSQPTSAIVRKNTSTAYDTIYFHDGNVLINKEILIFSETPNTPTDYIIEFPITHDSGELTIQVYN